MAEGSREVSMDGKSWAGERLGPGKTSLLTFSCLDDSLTISYHFDSFGKIIRVVITESFVIAVSGVLIVSQNHSLSLQVAEQLHPPEFLLRKIQPQAQTLLLFINKFLVYLL